MKRKIILSLLTVFLFSALGGAFATLYIRNTTATLSRLVNLYQIEGHRKDLVIATQTVQSDLTIAHTKLGHQPDLIIENVTNLEHAVQKCFTCHHAPEIAGQIESVQSLIINYRKALSNYIAAPADFPQSNKLKLDAAVVGNELLVRTAGMSQQASNRLERLTQDAMQKMKRAGTILAVTLVLTFVLAVMVAVNLTRAITRPINTLVNATRMIAGGDIGFAITSKDKDEFGELDSHFNAMSLSLKHGYAKLEEEIKERKQTEEALRVSEERYALAARGANDGLWDWDLRTNMIYYSFRWKSMLGYDEKNISGHPEEWFRRVHPDDRGEVEAKIAAHLSGRSEHFESEFRIMHKDGMYRWVLNRGLVIRDENGHAYRMAGSQTDITAKKTVDEQLVYNAFHDALTGLPNRALFMDRLQHLIAVTKRRANEIYAVLFLDMDRFKIINDSLGHTVGDQILVVMGQKLSECLRPGDTVARLGGDEFAVLLHNINEVKDAVEVAERIHHKLSAPLLIKEREVFSSVSIGIAMSSEHYERPEQVLRDADIAMYQAKARGNACHEIFDAKMHANILDRLQLEADMRGALDHNEFVLFYQPIIDLKTHQLISFEALVRWNHPTRGLIYPLEFIPMAEENGLINTIGEWILRESCRELRILQERYPKQPPLKMSVNISGKQFTQCDLASKVADIIMETGIDASTLALEITESMIMENVDTAVGTMNQLRSMGIQIHIDDFGTGYSSLSYLHRFPIDAIKIDRTFINKLTADGKNKEIIQSILSLATSLNFEVIAEGVEMNHQLVNMQNMQCQFGQGFLISVPMEPGAIDAWVQAEKIKT